MHLGVMRGLGALCAGAALVICAPDASAQQVNKQFMRVYQAGVDAFNLGDYAEARGLFEKALELDKNLPGPYRFLAAIAQKQERHEECVAHARKAVELNPKSEHLQALQAIHEACRAGLGRPSFRGDFMSGGAIWVDASEGGARIQLNGLSYGATPMEPRGFAAGKVTVNVSKEGFLSARAEGDVVPGLVTDIIVTLEPDPNATVSVTPDRDPTKEIEVGWLTIQSGTGGVEVLLNGKPAARDGQGRIEAAPEVYEVVVRAAEHEPWRRRVRVNRGQHRVLEVDLRHRDEVAGMRRKGYLALGAAGVLAGAGFAFAHLHGDTRDEAWDLWYAETQRPNRQTFDTHPPTTRDDLAELGDRARRYRILSAASLGLAGAALGTSIYYFATSRRVDRDGFPAPLVLTPVAPDGSGAGATVSYTAELDW